MVPRASSELYDRVSCCDPLRGLPTMVQITVPASQGLLIIGAGVLGGGVG